MTLRTSISLETMKQALEDKDKELALAQKEARSKTKAAEEKLASVSKLEEEVRTLIAAAEAARNEISELRKTNAEWETKHSAQASVFEGEKKTLDDQIVKLLEKKGELE
jgi:hypothetical protein